MANNDIIKVSTADMQACISKYQAEKAKLLSALAIAVKATAEMATAWAGPSFTITAVKMAQLFKNLNDSERKMADAIDELKKSIGIYTEAENTVKSSAGSLDVGTSPFS